MTFFFSHAGRAVRCSALSPERESLHFFPFLRFIVAATFFLETLAALAPPLEFDLNGNAAPFPIEAVLPYFFSF